MKLNRILLLAAACIILAPSCNKNEDKNGKYKGIVLNEIAPHEEAELDSWVHQMQPQRALSAQLPSL